jgi:C4-dicarboxylate-specific signal transduction histidine kinase
LPYSQISDQVAQLFAGIIEGSRRINEIVTNLKGFARQESVSLDNDVEINQVVSSAVSILRHEIGRMTEDFRFEPGDDLPPIKGNRHQLGQVIINLLMNACQALPDKSAAVTLRTYFDESAGQNVVVVQDQGCGIPAEAAAQIMDPFFTTKLDSGGTGLGLSICQSIIKDHKGSLEFHTGIGRGTTFFVKLPVGTLAQTDTNL